MAKVFLRMTSFICALSLLVPTAMWSESAGATTEAATTGGIEKAVAAANAATCVPVNPVDASWATACNTKLTKVKESAGKLTTLKQTYTGAVASESAAAAKSGVSTSGLAELASANAGGAAAITAARATQTADSTAWQAAISARMKAQKALDAGIKDFGASVNAYNAMGTSTPIDPSVVSGAQAESAKMAAQDGQAQAAKSTSDSNMGSILKTLGLVAAGAGLGYMLGSMGGDEGVSAGGSNGEGAPPPGAPGAPPGPSGSCPANTVLKNGICVVDSPDDAKCEANEELKEDGKCYAITDESRCGTGAKWDTARKACVLVSDQGKPVNIGDPEAVTLGDGSTTSDALANGDNEKKDPFAPDGSASGGAVGAAGGGRGAMGGGSGGGGPGVSSGRGFASFQAPSGGGGKGSGYGGGSFGGGSGADGKEAGQDAQNTLNYLKWENPVQPKTLEERLRDKY